MRVNIEINDDCQEQVRCVFYDDNNKRTVKTCSFFDFITALNTQADNNVDWNNLQEIGYPIGFIKAWMGNCTSGFTGVVILKKVSDKKLIVMNDVPYNIPLPSLIFKLWINKGNLVKDAVYAINNSMQLCRYPFTNVYNDAHICWGTCKLPVINNIMDTSQLPELFLKFPGNRDLTNTETLAFAGVDNVINLYSKLEHMDTFPDKWLKPVDISYEEFIKQV